MYHVNKKCLAGEIFPRIYISKIVQNICMQKQNQINIWQNRIDQKFLYFKISHKLIAVLQFFLSRRYRRIYKILSYLI